MINSKTTVSITSIICILLLFIGVFIGKITTNLKTVKTEKHDTLYVKTDSIIYSFIPVLERQDTVRDTILTHADTTAILKDYNISRKYSMDFSRDSIGTFKVFSFVSKNKLDSAYTIIKPFIREITNIVNKTTYKIPLIQFYGMIGSSLNLKTNKISWGMDFSQKYMIGISGIRISNNFGYTLDFGIKF